jgi:tRNA dimethylallyltransferase
MNIGTGKVTKREMAGIPHHLLDVADPKRTYTVAQFKRSAEDAIAQIQARGKLPIICGGTGLYVQAVIDDLSIPAVRPDLKLRSALEKLPAPELFARLRKLDPRRGKNIDKHNPRRLIRAIEIASSLGRVPVLNKRQRYDCLIIGIKPELAALDRKIEDRLIRRIKRGLVAEIQKLRARGISYKRLESFGLEYRFVSRYLQGKLGKEEMIEELTRDIRQYARRQLTWWRKDPRVHWVENPNDAVALATELLSRDPVSGLTSIADRD